MRQLVFRIKAALRRRLQARGGGLRQRLLPAGGTRSLPVRQLLRAVVLLRCLPPSRRLYREELRLTARSGLFDARWYLRQYPDVAQAWIDPLDHFIRYGAQEDRDPGPQFSSGWYKARYPDVARAGISPLTHYLLQGKREGRLAEPNLFGTTVPGATAEVPADAGNTPASPPATPAEAAVPVRFRRFSLPQAGQVPALQPAQETAAAEPAPLLLRLAGQTLCHVPAADEPAARGWMLAAVLLCRLSGVQPAGWMAADAPLALPEPSPWPHDGLLAFADEARIAILDVHHTGSHDLRLRLACKGLEPGAAVTAVQLDPFDGRKELVLSSARLVTDGTVFLDAGLANPFLPLLLMLTGAAGNLLGTALLPFPSLCRGGDHHGEALAHAPAAEGTGAVRQTSAAILDGWLAAGAPRPSLHIEIGIQNANGAERLLGRSFREWLQQATCCTMAPSCTQWQTGTGDDAARHWLQEVASLGQPAAEPAARLRLDAGSLPCLGALFCGASAADGPTPVILCDGLSGSPQWLLVPPQQDPALADTTSCAPAPFPVWGGGAGPAMAQAEPVPPAALHFLARKAPSQAEHVLPFSAGVTPEQILPGTALAHPAPAVCVLIRDDGNSGGLSASLEALLLQDWSGPLHIIVSVPAGHADEAAAVLARCLRQVEDGQPARSGGITSLDPQAGTADAGVLTALASGGLVLVMRSGVLLHDTRCLEILARVLSLPSTLSAGCMMVAGQWGRKTDEFVLVQCGNLAGPAFGQAVNYSTRFPASALAALPPATWAVEAGAPSLFLTRHADWERHGGLNPATNPATNPAADPLHTSFWENAAAGGGVHRVTSAVSASMPLPAGRDQAPLLPEVRSHGQALRLQRLTA